MGIPEGINKSRVTVVALVFFYLRTFCSFICLIMADRSDENKKEFSIEELNAWNVEKLRKYLKNRGVVITTDTRKRDLVSKVYHACRLDLPLCSTKEQDDAQIKAR